MLKERYDRNKNSLSQEELNILLQKRIGIVGCGGLGGYVIQGLSRLGVKSLTIIDGDEFQASNLNRQVFCTEDNLGMSKAFCVQQEIKRINSDVEVDAHQTMLNEDNIDSIFHNVDIIIDCVDNIPTRLLLSKYAKSKSLPLIHGAIGGYFGQVSTILPGDLTMDILYSGVEDANTIEKHLGNPPFIPMCIASIQVSECIKCLLGKPDILTKKILYIDLFLNDFEVIDIN